MAMFQSLPTLLLILQPCLMPLRPVSFTCRSTKSGNVIHLHDNLSGKVMPVCCYDFRNAIRNQYGNIRTFVLNNANCFQPGSNKGDFCQI